MLDWILCLMLEVVFGIVVQFQEQLVFVEEKFDDFEDIVEIEIVVLFKGEVLKKKFVFGGCLEFDCMKGLLCIVLCLVLVVLLFFWILDIWNIDFFIGEVVVKIFIKILVVVLVCYVVWGLINVVIQCWMWQEMLEVEVDDEKEEGGVGGLCIVILLLLLCKFMLVVIIVMVSLIVLLVLGVNIGFLIVGVGVFGLVIGFGVQILVKDIILGVFFFMDDVFWVGDYLEVVGIKGMVEYILLCFLRLCNLWG